MLALHEPHLHGTVRLENPADHEIEPVVLLDLARVVGVQDVLDGQEIGPEVGADRLDAGGILESVDAQPDLLVRPDRNGLGRKGIEQRLLERSRRIADQVDVRLGPTVAVVGQLFGKQVVFHGIVIRSSRKNTQISRERHVPTGTFCPISARRPSKRATGGGIRRSGGATPDKRGGPGRLPTSGSGIHTP